MSFLGNYGGIAKACEKDDTSRMSHVPKMWYQYFFKTKFREEPIIYGSSTSVKKMLKYAIGKNTKIDIYNSLKHKVFNDMPNSRVIQEVVGIWMFVTGLLSYIKLSIQVKWLEK